MKKKQSVKARAASLKNILTYEWKDDSTNILIGFIMGSITCFIAACIAVFLAMNV